MSVRYRNGQGLFIDYPSEAIIDEETGERYYDGIKPNYVSSKEVCKLLNNLTNDNKQLKARIQLLSTLLDIADTIIDLSDDEKAKAFWEKKNRKTEQEWEKILSDDEK